jgi:hypothetical protein
MLGNWMDSKILDDAFQLTLDVIFPKKSPVNAKTT